MIDLSPYHPNYADLEQRSNVVCSECGILSDCQCDEDEVSRVAAMQKLPSLEDCRDFAEKNPPPQSWYDEDDKIQPFLDPYGEYVLVHKATPDLSKRIIVPDRYQARADRGTVLAVGCGRRTSEGFMEPPACQPGDVVAFDPLTGHDVKMWGESVLLIRETEILAVLG